MEPTFFATPEEFRAWLEEHHETEAELLDPLHAAQAAQHVERGERQARGRTQRAGPHAPRRHRRTATCWVISAKKPETRERRLQQLTADSAAGRTIRSLTPPARRGASGAGPG
jgi:uncharacterized protein YdeI (YjbR/CyaY-like superfamily)